LNSLTYEGKQAMDDLRISSERLKADFEALSQFGATPEGGVDRPALGEAHLAARAWLRRRIQADGLELRLDQAGNQLISPHGSA
jgi:N-carbamoyl-L-amino-acid hydrolase